MQFGFCLLLLGTVVTAKRTAYQLIPKLNDLHLLQEYSLGPPTSYTRADQCAQYCGGTPQCSLFSFNHLDQTCQLYEDIMYIDGSLAQQRHGAKYFAYRTAWCPLSSGFFMLRAANMCVKLMTGTKSYDDARAICQQFGARLVVLEDEDKATAVVNLLATLDLSDTRFYLGVDDRIMEDQFVWVDGRLMTRDRWRDREPNGGDRENCVTVFHGGLLDISCSWQERFICEMPE